MLVLLLYMTFMCVCQGAAESTVTFVNCKFMVDDAQRVLPLLIMSSGSSVAVLDSIVPGGVAACEYACAPLPVLMSVVLASATHIRIRLRAL
jgi:hypothetical protein